VQQHSLLLLLNSFDTQFAVLTQPCCAAFTYLIMSWKALQLLFIVSYAMLQNAVQRASEEHAESKSTQPLLPASAQDAEQALKMPFFDSCMSIDMGISSDPSEDDFWVDPDMWNSDSDDATDSVCSILLEGAQSCSVPVDVPQCNLNLGNMDDLFNFVGGSPTFDKLWIPAQ